MPTFDPLEPRTNKSVFAFAVAIRDQLAAILASNFATAQGFSKFQLWQTPSAVAGGGGLYLGDTAAAQWDFRLDASGNLHVDRFASGVWSADVFVIDRATGRVGIGGAAGFAIYAEGGAAKVRGASGTVTTFGPAEPHCPVCGADFMTEHESPRYGYLAICLRCLAGELGERPYIVRRSPADVTA